MQGCTKHINIRFYFVRKILVEGDIKLRKIHNKENPADMLTKVVPGMKFAYCKELLHIFKVLQLDGVCLNELRMA